MSRDGIQSRAALLLHRLLVVANHRHELEVSYSCDQIVVLLCCSVHVLVLMHPDEDLKCSARRPQAAGITESQHSISGLVCVLKVLQAACIFEYLGNDFSI